MNGQNVRVYAKVNRLMNRSEPEKRSKERWMHYLWLERPFITHLSPVEPVLSKEYSMALSIFVIRLTSRQPIRKTNGIPILFSQILSALSTFVSNAPDISNITWDTHECLLLDRYLSWFSNLFIQNVVNSVGNWSLLVGWRTVSIYRELLDSSQIMCVIKRICFNCAYLQRKMPIIQMVKGSHKAWHQTVWGDDDADIQETIAVSFTF